MSENTKQTAENNAHIPRTIGFTDLFTIWRRSLLFWKSQLSEIPRIQTVESILHQGFYIIAKSLEIYVESEFDICDHRHACVHLSSSYFIVEMSSARVVKYSHGKIQQTEPRKRRNYFKPLILKGKGIYHSHSLSSKDLKYVKPVVAVLSLTSFDLLAYIEL